MAQITLTPVYRLGLIDKEGPYPFYAMIEERKVIGQPTTYRLDYIDNTGYYMLNYYNQLFNAKRAVTNRVTELGFSLDRLVWAQITPKVNTKIKLSKDILRFIK